jgi:hypothetical protein
MLNDSPYFYVLQKLNFIFYSLRSPLYQLHRFSLLLLLHLRYFTKHFQLNTFYNFTL